MADGTHIEWTDATWNPVTGCSVVSPGCTNCYAMKLAGTRLQDHPSRAGLTKPSKAGPVWTGEVRFNEGWLDQPLRWKRPRRIFVCAHADLFHENVPDEWIDKVFAVMALAPQHQFQVLTKRSKRMREYMTRPLQGDWAGRSMRVNSRTGQPEPSMDADWRVHAAVTDKLIFCPPGTLNRAAKWLDANGYGDVGFIADWPLPNVWLGVSVEDQARADERIPDLLATPAAVRWISAEPLLGPVDLTGFSYGEPIGNAPSYMDVLGGRVWMPEGSWSGVGHTVGGRTYVDLCKRLDWVVVGGESGPGSRPMHPDWARSLRDQCAAAGVPFLFKQWGDWISVLDRDTHDPDWRGNYTDLRNQKRAIINYAGGMGFHGERVHVVENIGKARAGRLLDGVEHNGYPGAAR